MVGCSTPDGEVYEMVERVIPGGFLDFFEHTEDEWKLKPEASGLVICGTSEELVVGGLAGSAQKCAIDLDGMRNPIDKAAAEWWDCADSACGSRGWEPFEAIWKKYENDKWSEEIKSAAEHEWAEQTSSGTVNFWKTSRKCNFSPASPRKLF